MRKGRVFPVLPRAADVTSPGEVESGSDRSYAAKRIAKLHPAFDRPGGAEDNVAAFSEALIERGWADGSWN